MRDNDRHSLIEITSDDVGDRFGNSGQPASGRLIADTASAAKSPPVIPNLPVGAKLVPASSLKNTSRD